MATSDYRLRRQQQKATQPSPGPGSNDTQNAVLAALRARGQSLQVTAPPPSGVPLPGSRAGMGRGGMNPALNPLLASPIAPAPTAPAVQTAIPAPAGFYGQGMRGGMNPALNPLLQPQGGEYRGQPLGGTTMMDKAGNYYSQVQQLPAGLKTAVDKNGRRVYFDPQGNLVNPQGQQMTEEQKQANLFIPRGEAEKEYALMSPGNLGVLPVFGMVPPLPTEPTAGGGYGYGYGGRGGGGGGGGRSYPRGGQPQGGMKDYLQRLGLVNWNI